METPKTIFLTGNDPQKRRLLEITGNPKCPGITDNTCNINFDGRRIKCRRLQCKYHDNCAAYTTEQQS